jgi:hypothetical protein
MSSLMEQEFQTQIQSDLGLQHSLSTRIVKIAALSLFVLAIALSLIRGVGHANSQFVGPHAFVSADVATTARTFSSEGIWKLHGIPVNNNAPMGVSDRYTHWPPLLPIFLSLCFRLFGASEYVCHLLMLGVLLGTALLVFRLGTMWLGLVGGAMAGYFWLTLPVVVQFADLVAQQSLAMFFVVAALVAFFSSRDKFGAGLLFFGVLSAWEAALVLPGVWLASCWRPELRRTVAMAAIGIGAGIACVLGLFALGSSTLTTDTVQTLKYYMGLSSIYSHVLPHDRGELSFTQQISAVLWNHLWMLGALGIAAIVELIAVRPRNGVLLLSALAAPWILWTIVMRTHVAIHHFELLIAAPLAALALAWVATAELRVVWSTNGMFRAAAFVAFAGLQLVVLPKPQIALDHDTESLVHYARDIRSSTPVGAVVLAPLLSSIPLYYSERHIVRGVVNGDELDKELPDIRREFPEAPVYMAIPPTAADSFASVLLHATIVRSTVDVIVAKLDMNEVMR